MNATSEADLAREICRRCFGREGAIEAIGGSSNAVFRLRLPAGVHILKLARDAQARKLHKEHMLLELLRRQLRILTEYLLRGK